MHTLWGIQGGRRHSPEQTGPARCTQSNVLKAKGSAQKDILPIGLALPFGFSRANEFKNL